MSNTNNTKRKSKNFKKGKEGYKGNRNTRGTHNSGSAYDRSTDISITSTNDPGWYAATDQLLKDAASLPFAKRVGDYITLKSDQGYISGRHLSIPGIMTLHMLPTFGNPQTLSDPMNMAASNLFAKVRKHNSGATNYGKANLMIYMLAMGSAYAYYGYLTRLYGLAKLYTPESKYFPKQIYRSMYVDMDDIHANMAQLRMFINLYAEKLNYFAVPKSFKLYNRMFMLYSNLYLDRPSKKGQVYIFNPIGFHVYGEPATTESKYVGTLKIKNIKDFNTKDLIKVSDLISFGSTILDPIVYSQDYDVISGDIRKAFDDLTIVPQITEDYSVVPVYDELILEQIHNCDVVHTVIRPEESAAMASMNAVATSDFGTISEYMEEDPNAGALVMASALPKASAPYPSGTALLDLLAESPSPGEVIESTRLKFTTSCAYDKDASSSSAYSADIQTCGTEVVYAATYTFLDYLGTPKVYELVTRATGLYTEMLSVTAFNRYPIIKYFSTTASDKNPRLTAPVDNKVISNIMGELQNLTQLEPDSLINMNQIAMMSLFAL